jgi:hypothetical protein
MGLFPQGAHPRAVELGPIGAGNGAADVLRHRLAGWLSRPQNQDEYEDEQAQEYPNPNGGWYPIPPGVHRT